MSNNDVSEQNKIKENEITSNGITIYSESDIIVQKCLQKLYIAPSEDEAIKNVMAFLGESFGCDRIGIFSVHNDRWVETDYEWCAEGLPAFQKKFQREPFENYVWSRDFYQQSIVLLNDIEKLRIAHPSAYALMRSRQVNSVISLFMPFDQNTSAVLGLENFDLTKSSLIKEVLEKLNRHLASQLKRRNMLHQLKEMSFHDQLTGAYNRNALTDLYKGSLSTKSIGVIFCDVSGLKQVNDTQGHEKGDEMITQCYRLIQQSVRTDRIYRMGGDEFLALCFDADQDSVKKDYNTLKAKIAESEHHIAVGYVWSDEAPLILEPLIAAADHEMYRDKQEYYSTRDYFKRMATQSTEAVPNLDEDTAFQKYIKSNYFDAEAFLRSMTVNNTNQFFFFGDVQKNFFYVSDNMRDRFGFKSNLMVNLPHYWEQCICDEEYKRMNSQAVERMFEEKMNTYELLHIVQDVHENRIWVHNSGTLQWNSDRTVPLFLSGRITVQDKDYTIDPISGFKKDYKALVELEEMEHAGQECAVIGFCLNHYTKINTKVYPTYHGNMLLYHIGQHLNAQLKGKVSFYRLDGDYFMAVLSQEYTEQQLSVMEQIRTIIEEEYQSIGVYDVHPVSFALLHYTKKAGSPYDFLESMYERIDTARDMPNLPYVTATDEQLQQIEQNKEMAAVLRKNVENNMENFRIVIQLADDAKTGEIAGGESLLRWNYKGVDIYPNELFPLLEREGLMVQVDLWVIEQVFNTRAKLHGFTKDGILSFNVSYQALQSKGFTEFINELMERYEVDKYTFFAELNESHILSRGEDINYFAAFCNRRGICIMQKRFGNRISLFRAAMSPYADVVKVHCSLLNTFEKNEEKIHYLETLADLCHKFGKKIGVTGIETEEEYNLVKNCGCDYLQGFYIRRPMELPEIYALLFS